MWCDRQKPVRRATATSSARGSCRPGVSAYSCARKALVKASWTGGWRTGVPRESNWDALSLLSAIQCSWKAANCAFISALLLVSLWLVLKEWSADWCSLFGELWYCSVPVYDTSLPLSALSPSAYFHSLWALRLVMCLLDVCDTCVEQHAFDTLQFSRGPTRSLGANVMQCRCEKHEILM